MEKNNAAVIGLLGVIIGGMLGYGISANKQIATTSPTIEQNGESTKKQTGMMHQMPDGTMMGNSDTGNGMMGGMGMMMVSNEKEFITEMIPHHQEAVDIAKIVLTRGATTPEIKTLLEHIVTVQEKEIAAMKSWYLAWYGTPYAPNGKYQPMMRDLSKLSGKELDKAFLEDMVMHHMEAIMMAHSVEGYIEHTEIRDLAKAIITTQSAEIHQMRTMRAGLQ